MSKKTIAIIELHYHAEVLQNLFNFLDFEQFNIQLFVAEAVAKELNIPKKIKTIIVKNITQHETELLASDILFFNTFADYFDELLPIIVQKRTIVRIHNANTWFGKQGMASPRNNYERWKFMSHFVRKELLGKLSSKRQQAIEHINQFVFPAEFMRSEALKLRPKLSAKFTAEIIPLVEQKTTKISLNKIKHIVIPGRIDQRKKDYDFALAVIKKISEQHASLQITLLGKPQGNYGKQVIDQLIALRSKTNKINTFSDFIPFNEFENLAQSADVFFLPLVEQTSFTMYHEVYGKTKISGAINDAIHYGKPMLLPSFYPIDGEYKHFATHYTTEQDAVDKLHKILQTKPPVVQTEKEKLTKRYSNLFLNF